MVYRWWIANFYSKQKEKSANDSQRECHRKTKSSHSSFVIVSISCESEIGSCVRLLIEHEDGGRKSLSTPNEFLVLCICRIFHARGCLARTPAYTLDRTERKKNHVHKNVFSIEEVVIVLPLSPHYARKKRSHSLTSSRHRVKIITESISNIIHISIAHYAMRFIVFICSNIICGRLSKPFENNFHCRFHSKQIR